MNPIDLINLVNGSLKSLSIGLMILGAVEVQKSNYTGGGILMAAGLLCGLLYEFAPDKPTTAVTTTTSTPVGTVATTTINPVIVPAPVVPVPTPTIPATTPSV